MWQGQYNAPHESLTWLQRDKARVTEASSLCYDVSSVKRTRLKTKNKRISQVHGSKGH